MQPPNLHLPRDRLQSETGNVSRSVPASDTYELLHSSPPQKILSPARSETDSVYQTLGENFTQLGPYPVNLDTSSVSTPIPSQSLME